MKVNKPRNTGNSTRGCVQKRLNVKQGARQSRETIAVAMYFVVARLVHMRHPLPTSIII